MTFEDRKSLVIYPHVVPPLSHIVTLYSASRGNPEIQKFLRGHYLGDPSMVAALLLKSLEHEFYNGTAALDSVVWVDSDSNRVRDNLDPQKVEAYRIHTRSRNNYVDLLVATALPLEDRGAIALKEIGKMHDRTLMQRGISLDESAASLSDRL